MTDKPVFHVVRIPHGWWEVRRQNGEILARYTTESAAWTAGRAAAQASSADLFVHNLEGPPFHESYDGTANDSGLPQGDEPADARQTASDVDDRKALILLVEDMLDARELYADYLGYAGFSVVTAINGHEAIGLARLLRPDLILMDIRLPGMDGLEATADIKAEPELAHIPILAITADSSHDIAERAREAGCSALIFKPVLPDEVVQQINELLGLQAHRADS